MGYAPGQAPEPRKRQAEPKSLMEFIGSQPGLEEPRWLKAYCELWDSLAQESPRWVACHIPPQHWTTFTTLAGMLSLARQCPGISINYATYNAYRAKDCACAFHEMATGSRCLDNREYHMWQKIGESRVRFTSVGGATLGFAMDIGVLDSPYHYWNQAQSEEHRSRVSQWLRAAWLTRRKPNSRMVVVGPRMHANDVHGELIENGWEHINLKAVANGPDPNGRAEGEPLWEEQAEHYKLAARDRKVFRSLCQGEPEA